MTYGAPSCSARLIQAARTTPTTAAGAYACGVAGAPTQLPLLPGSTPRSGRGPAPGTRLTGSITTGTTSPETSAGPTTPTRPGTGARAGGRHDQAVSAMAAGHHQPARSGRNLERVGVTRGHVRIRRCGTAARNRELAP